MKKFLAALVLTFVVLAVATPKLLGFSIFKIDDAVKVATGIGAKLACSAYFVSGFDKDLIIEDIASYSEVNRKLSLEYDDQAQRVTASLFGMATTSASYRPGLGCTLDIGDTSALDQVHVPAMAERDAAWPAGNGDNALDTELQQRAEAILAADNAAGLQTRALVVIQDGHLVAEAYGDGFNAETKLLGWSMGKSLTAMLQGRLEALGHSPADEPVFSAWGDDARRDIRMPDLLQMASGLQFDETYAPGSDSTRMLFTEHSASDVALASPAGAEPGSYFSYSSGTTNLIARWIHDKVGGTAQDSVNFIHRELFAPLGMADSVLEVDPAGVFVGSSYIFATGRDWARLGQLMLDNGVVAGEQLLPAEWVARAIAPNDSDNDPRYGYQFWLNNGGEELRYPELPADSYFMLGNRKQVVMMSPSTNTVIVRLGWSKDAYPTGANFAQLLPDA